MEAFFNETNTNEHNVCQFQRLFFRFYSFSIIQINLFANSNGFIQMFIYHFQNQPGFCDANDDFPLQPICILSNQRGKLKEHSIKSRFLLVFFFLKK